MLYLHVSNRTENLLRHLVEVLQASGRRSPFAKEIFLIQSQGMERMISQGLATHFTSWCNFEYFLPVTFIEYCCNLLGLDSQSGGYERSVLTWRLEQLLRDVEGEEYAHLHHYLQGDSLPLKRYQLAAQLANNFDQYQLMRPDMLQAWEEGRRQTDSSHEIWQRQLWLRLQKNGRGEQHRGAALATLIHCLNNDKALAKVLPTRLSVFGLSIMPPLFLEFLQALGNQIDVHLYVLSPCKEFWGDLDMRRTVLMAGADAHDPDKLDSSPESHPLLVGFGRQGRDFQRMLFNDSIQFTMEFSSYHDPLADNEQSLLSRLQSDLLKGEVKSEQSVWDTADNSIHIVNCHSKYREISIVKEHILDWLHNDKGLHLRDIVVMAPDIQEYAPLIPAIFDDIQHSISDRSLRRRNSLLAAFADFLGLYTGRFTWEEVFALLQEKAIADNYSLTQIDLANLQRWVVSAGVRWGLSAEQRLSDGLPAFGEGSWRDGIARMLMGYASSSDEFMAGVLPYQGIEGGAGAALGSLCQFIDLIEQGREDVNKARSLTAWSELLLDYSTRLFCGDREDLAPGKDYLELRDILSQLGEVDPEYHSDEVEFSVISSWIETTAAETRSSSGFLRGQLTFCSMLPMRSIPFKRVCLLGLNDGSFPRDDRHASFDLMGVTHRPGDRSRRMDDRYQFLEAIMSAREGLYISYVGQSIKNNEPLQPSVVVTELIEVLQTCYRAEHLLAAHPLHPFSSRYFTGAEPSLFSYDKSALAVAEASYSDSPEAAQWWHGRVEKEWDHIHFEHVCAFFRSPQRWFVKNCLGIRLDLDLDVVDGSEPFDLDPLENYLVNDALLENLVNTHSAKELCERLQVESRWMLGEPGRLAFREREDEVEAFVERLQSLNLGDPHEPLEFDVEIGTYRLCGTLRGIHANGILLSRFTKFNERDLLLGWLHRLVYEHITGQNVPVLIAARDKTMVLPADMEPDPGLSDMLDLFVEGSREPSRLLIGPAVAYIKKQKEPELAHLKATTKLVDQLEKGFDPELELLLRGGDPASFLDSRFLEVTRNIVAPILRGAHVS